MDQATKQFMANHDQDIPMNESLKEASTDIVRQFIFCNIICRFSIPECLDKDKGTDYSFPMLAHFFPIMVNFLVLPLPFAINFAWIRGQYIFIFHCFPMS